MEHPNTSPGARRGFLKSLAAAVAATATTPLIARGQARRPTRNFDLVKSLSNLSPQDERYWEQVKRQFTIQPDLIMVNAANLCPSPHFVQERVAQLSEQIAGDVSFQNRGSLSELRNEALLSLARFLGVQVEEVGITRNTSESNNIVVNGLDFGPGDEVLVWEQNHPTNNLAWFQRAKRFGFTVKSISLPAKPERPAELVEAINDAVSSRTRLIAFSHISNVTGLALPAPDICRLARQRNILTLVDGAQSFGFANLDLAGMGCDFYSGSTHKWLMGPMENGVIFARREHHERLWPNIVAAGWSEDHATLDQQVCVLGQRNTPSAPAIVDILEFHTSIGKSAVEDRTRQLNAYLKDQVRHRIPGASQVTPREPELSGGVSIFQFPGYEARDLFQKLYTDHGIACAPTGGLRFSPHIYNTLADMDRVVDALLDLVS